MTNGDIGVPGRIHKKFNDIAKDIQKQRISKGKDDPNRPISLSRITLAITRHELFDNQIKKDIIEADIKPKDLKRLLK